MHVFYCQHYIGMSSTHMYIHFSDVRWISDGVLTTVRTTIATTTAVPGCKCTLYGLQVVQISLSLWHLIENVELIICMFLHQWLIGSFAIFDPLLNWCHHMTSKMLQGQGVLENTTILSENIKTYIAHTKPKQLLHQEHGYDFLIIIWLGYACTVFLSPL